MTSVKDMKIIVTGAASGIGRAIATLLSDNGASLACLDRDHDGLESNAPRNSLKLMADITDKASVERAVSDMVKQLGGIDGVINAAGIAENSKISDISFERWNQVLAVNLTGPFLLCQAAYPHLLKSKKAAVVNIGSASGLLPSGASSAYAASKGGLIMATKAMAAEWGPNIRVNAVCPGTVDTPMLDNLFEKDEAFLNKMKQVYALQRMARPEEIAEAVQFLISPVASFITGVSLAVDGGRSYH